MCMFRRLVFDIRIRFSWYYILQSIVGDQVNVNFDRYNPSIIVSRNWQPSSI